MGYWRVLEPHERLQVDTWAVSNGRRRICRRTRLGFLWSWKMLFWLFLDNESGYLGQRFMC